MLSIFIPCLVTLKGIISSIEVVKSITRFLTSFTCTNEVDLQRIESPMEVEISLSEKLYLILSLFSLAALRVSYLFSMNLVGMSPYLNN